MRKAVNPTAEEESAKAEKKVPVLSSLVGILDEGGEANADVLGVETLSEPVSDTPPSKKRAYFALGIFVLAMAIVGTITVINSIIGFFSGLSDDSSVENELAAFIYPVVLNDINTFESPNEIKNSVKIKCAIWEILLKNDLSGYTKMGRYIQIPQVDVEIAANKLFAQTDPLVHEAVGTTELTFRYDESIKSYIVPEKISYIPYYPEIEDIEVVGDTYTLTVGYMPPSAMIIPGMSGTEPAPDKYMEYIVSRAGGKNTLVALRFSDWNDEELMD